jgi:hypothetical protein
MAALLPFTDRLAAITEMSSGEAAAAVARLSALPGAETSLVINGAPVTAQRHELPHTRDWAVTATDPRFAVCIAGRAGFDPPELCPADLAPWTKSLQEQFIQMGAAPPIYPH